MVILFGQATTEAIAASFCDQIINYMEIAGIRNARQEFIRHQTPELQKIMEHYEALDIAGRDWAVLLSWITGNPRRTERTQGEVKSFFVGSDQLAAGSWISVPKSCLRCGEPYFRENTLESFNDGITWFLVVSKASAGIVADEVNVEEAFSVRGGVNEVG